MTTINLEKSLIRENKKLVTPQELLLVNEYDKFTEFAENDALDRIGLNRNLKQGRSIKSAIDKKKDQTKPFNQERIFHISQIEAICKKYRLRFLSSYYYTGIIDAQLPNRISNFEIAYNVRCNRHNTKIIAPIESFKLQQKPKDPLMFYEINDEYFYLIHKWGNDLSLFRRILPLFESALFCWLFPALILTPLFLFGLPIGLIATVPVFVASTMFYLVELLSGGAAIGFLKPNRWNSEYE